jgi:Glycosyltransferase family 87
VYWKLINNPDVAAAYPPAVQFGLAGGVLISGTPLGMKVMFGLCDVLIFVVLWLWLPRIGSKSRLAIIHGFCPLMVLEFAGEGHSDTLPVLFILLCLYAFSRGRRSVSAAMLAVATAGKLMPVVLLPFVARRGWWVLVPFTVVIAALYAPFVWGLAPEDWPRIFQGTVRYADAWRANDSVFHMVHSLAELVLEWLDSIGVETVFKDYPHRLAKVPIVLFGAALLLLAWLRRWPLQKVAAAVFMLFVSFTPTMHPWYLAFLVPFLCIYPSTLWLVFTGTIYLAYHVRPDWIAMQQAIAPGAQAHIEKVVLDLGIKTIEYIPFYLGFIGVLLDTRSGAATDRQAWKR